VQISPSGAAVGGKPDRNVDDQEGGAGGLGTSGPGGGGGPRGRWGGPDGGSTGGLDWGVLGDGSGSSSRALRAAIGIKRADSEVAAPASTRMAREAPEAAAPTSWDGRDVDGRLGSMTWAGSESMATARSRTTAAVTQIDGTGEVRQGTLARMGC
jgi:hypothetical protein